MQHYDPAFVLSCENKILHQLTDLQIFFHQTDFQSSENLFQLKTRFQNIVFDIQNYKDYLFLFEKTDLEIWKKIQKEKLSCLFNSVSALLCIIELNKKKEKQEDETPYTHEVRGLWL